VTARHLCHWPTCNKDVAPRFWGCSLHWYLLPEDIRREIWRTYSPGQEITKTPSPAYVQAARRAREWAEAEIAAGRVK